MKTLLVLLSFALFLAVSAYASTIKIELPHLGFSSRSAICLTNIQSQKSITIWTKDAATIINENSVVHQFVLPEKISGRHILKFVEGTFAGSGWYSLIDLVNEDAVKDIKMPDTFTCLSIAFDKACRELDAYDETKDYCLRLYRLKQELGLDPYFVAGVQLAVDSKNIELGLVFAEPGSYVLQIVSLDGLTVLYQKPVSIDDKSLIKYSPNTSLVNLSPEKKKKIQFTTNDYWQGWVSPIIIRRPQ